MRFVQRLRAFARPFTSIPTALVPSSPINSAWKVEKSGNLGSYTVSGWRYADIAIWHVRVSLRSEPGTERSYLVAGEEFYPEPGDSAERLATIRLIKLWDVDEFKQ